MPEYSDNDPSFRGFVVQRMSSSDYRLFVSGVRTGLTWEDTQIARECRPSPDKIKNDYMWPFSFIKSTRRATNLTLWQDNMIRKLIDLTDYVYRIVKLSWHENSIGEGEGEKKTVIWENGYAIRIS